MLLPILAAHLAAQTQLTSGVPVGFTVNETFAVLLNGKNGYVIPVPSDPFEMTIQVQIAPTDSQMAVYARCGVDVGGAATNSPVYDAMNYTINGTANLLLVQPSQNTNQNCYVAMEAHTQGNIGGRLTATIQALPSGTQVSVSSLGSIYLAGQPGGTKLGNLSVPANSPAQASISLTPGQGLSIVASGHVGGVASEGVFGLQGQDLAAAFGLSQARVPDNALIGVFTGDSIQASPTPVGIDFVRTELGTVQTLYPLLQQVFYIGNGMTLLGQTRVIVVPPGATRLFLASAAGGFAASGSFTASISQVPIPAAPTPTNPLIVSSLGDLFLIDQPNGVVTGNGYAAAITPYSLPSQVPIPLTAGENLSIIALDEIHVGGATGVTATGGLSGLPLLAGLGGVFVGDTINKSSTPATLPSNENLLTLAPLLQQSFYIGAGLTSSGQVRTFTVPSGATRLFLASPGGGFAQTGFAPVIVGVNSANAPQISKGGIVSNAGFATGAVSPGSMVAIFGSNLGPQTFASTVPLPTNLGGTQVFFNQVPAPLFYVSPTQVVVEVPFEMYGLPNALVTVVANGIAGIPQVVSLTSYAAQLFTTGTGDPVITDYNTGQLVSTSAPASRGDIIFLWVTGLGPTLLDPATGNPAPNAASPAGLPVQVILKSSATGAQVSAPVLYAGLAPNYIALGQINVQIPQNAPTGTVILELQSPGLAAANPVTIGIQ